MTLLGEPPQSGIVLAGITFFDASISYSMAVIASHVWMLQVAYAQVLVPPDAMIAGVAAVAAEQKLFFSQTIVAMMIHDVPWFSIKCRSTGISFKHRM
jgi:hypothetical protein